MSVCAVAGCAKSVHAVLWQAASQFGNCCGCAVGNPDCLLPPAYSSCCLAGWLPPPAAAAAALFAVSANKLAKCQLRLLFSRKREIQNRRKTKPKRVATLRVAEQPNKQTKKKNNAFNNITAHGQKEKAREREGEKARGREQRD